MRVIVSGGGTGGHIYPAVSIARAIQKLKPEAEILFVGTEYGLESKIVPQTGFNIEYIEVEGFTRKLGLGLLKNVWKAFVACWQSYKIIREFKPDLVLGTGGYVCGPVLLTASLLGVKTCIQEQNATTGITNRILSIFVNKIFWGYDKSTEELGSKGIFTGNPVRDSIFNVYKQDAYDFFNLSSKNKTLLVYGGSRGARSINNAMLDLYRNISQFPDLQIIHVTGSLEYDRFVNDVKKLDIDTSLIKIFPYLNEMDLALNISNIAVSRAGAMAISEFLALGIPAILVPYPYATANHQYFNAMAVARANAGIVISDSELQNNLVSALGNLLNDEETLLIYKNNAKRLGKRNAAEEIAYISINLIKS